ncbi:MAG: hypothetical protein NE330_08570 [Lentisphaeraceae bacterium]|nr:hypothetical protein [Lentisphaeraceae bacterium]
MENEKDILDKYNEGVVTISEVVYALINLSLKVDPNNYIPNLPPYIIEKLRIEVSAPPSSVDVIGIPGNVSRESFSTEKEWELTYKLWQVKAFAARWRMHSHFFSTQK